MARVADLDLNLLRTFVLLYRTGSVTETAVQLSVTQPSVSYGLKRLRKHFADELFLRSAAGLTPTPMTSRMYPEIHQALDVIDSAMHSVSVFEPAGSTRTFRLLATDMGEFALAPAIIGALIQQAPGVRLSIEPLDFETVHTDLRSVADAALCASRINSPDLNRDVVLRDRYVGMCAQHHPRIGDSPSTSAFMAERHVAVNDTSGQLDVDRSLSQQGSLRDIAVRVPHFVALPRLVETTDMLAVIPASVAQQFSALANVRTFELPVTVPTVEIALYTYRRVVPSPSSEWFRTVVCGAMR